MTEDLQSLYQQREANRLKLEELNKKISEAERELACPICDGTGVLRGTGGGFNKCFACSHENKSMVSVEACTLRTKNLKSGKKLVWNIFGIGLLYEKRREGWGGALERAWFASDSMYDVLIEILELT